MTESRRPFRRQVLVNTASSGIANVWAMVVAFVSLPLLLRGLGQDAFGTYVLLMTFSATNGWFSLGDLGVVVATTREVASRASAGDDVGTRQSVSSSLALCTGLGLIGGLALAVVGPIVLPTLFNTPDDLVGPLQSAIVALAVQIVLDLAINSLEASLEGLQRVDLSRWVDMFRRTIVVGATATAALITGDLLTVAIASATATGVAAVVAVVVLWRQLPRFATVPSRIDHIGLLRYGSSVALLRPLGVLQRTMDRVIVGAVLGPAAVALVEIAAQLQAGAEAVLSASSYAVVPASSWLTAREDHGTMGELAERGTRYSVLATLPLVIAIATLSPAIVAVWVGPNYAEAAGLTTVAVLSVALAAPLAVGSQMLLGMGRASTILRAALVAVAINLSLSILLVHVIGIVGVFIATLVGAAVLLPLLGRPFLRATGLGLGTFVRTTLRPVLAPAVLQLIVTLAVVALPLSALATVIAGGGLGVAVFGSAALRWSLAPGELAELRSVLRPGRGDPDPIAEDPAE